MTFNVNIQYRGVITVGGVTSPTDTVMTAPQHGGDMHAMSKP